MKWKSKLSRFYYLKRCFEEIPICCQSRKGADDAKRRSSSSSGGCHCQIGCWSLAGQCELQAEVGQWEAFPHQSSQVESGSQKHCLLLGCLLTSRGGQTNGWTNGQNGSLKHLKTLRHPISCEKEVIPVDWESYATQHWLACFLRRKHNLYVTIKLNLCQHYVAYQQDSPSRCWWDSAKHSPSAKRALRAIAGWVES